MYDILNEEAMRQLRRERIAALEADHFRLRLQMDETTNDEEMQRIHLNMNDIERRIAVHRNVLSPPSAHNSVSAEASTDASSLVAQNSGDGG